MLAVKIIDKTYHLVPRVIAKLLQIYAFLSGGANWDQPTVECASPDVARRAYTRTLHLLSVSPLSVFCVTITIMKVAQVATWQILPGLAKTTLHTHSKTYPVQAAYS